MPDAALSSSPVTLRAYRATDLPALLDIAVAAWGPIYALYLDLLGPELFAIVYTDWQTEKRRQIESACQGEHGAKVIVAERDGQPIGFVSYYINHETGVGEIGNNAVAPQHQGEGVGQRLYEQALAAMRQEGMRCASVDTGLDAAHAPARRAYEKAGFQRGLPGITYFRKL